MNNIPDLIEATDAYRNACQKLHAAIQEKRDQEIALIHAAAVHERFDLLRINERLLQR